MSKDNRKYLVVFLFVNFLFVSSHKLFTQQNNFKLPPSISCLNCQTLSAIPEYILPYIDNDSLSSVDSLLNTDTTGQEMNYFAYPIPFNVSLDNSGVWDTLQDSSLIWRIKITSFNSYFLILRFEELQINKFATLYAYTPDTLEIKHYNYKSNKTGGMFSVGLFNGASVILEYHLPKTEIKNKGILKTKTVFHAFKSLSATINDDLNGSANCQYNVKCNQFNEYCDQRRSVALMAVLSDENHLVGGCTGSLLTNGKRDLKPYFLTARHCYWCNNNLIPSEQVDFIFLFNHQSQNCDNPTQLPIFDVLEGGATIVAANEQTDFALFELSQRLPGSYNTYYSGWYAVKEKPSSGACIHHPKSDIKKISLYTKEAKFKNKIIPLCEGESSGPDKTWDIDWDLGIIEKGSSGAPLFNQNKRVIGQATSVKKKLSCKKQNKGSLFGRFDISWDASGNSSERLYDWLHGTQSNIVGMSGDEPCKINYVFQNANDLHTSANVSHLGPVYPGDRTYNGVYECTNEITIGNNVTIQSGTNVVMNAGYRIVALPGSKSELGSNFHAYIEGCLRGCDNGVGRMDNDFYEQYEYDFSDETTQKILQDETIAEIKIYPNPSSGIFTIESEEAINPQQIEVYDVFGKRVQPIINPNGTSATINLENQSKGIYLVRIGIFKQKIVLE
jgi:hypothetical protein